MEDICSTVAAVGAQADMAHANGFEVGSRRMIYLFDFCWQKAHKGGNEGDVRKTAGAPSPQAVFPIN
jgi:hypothetical protein